jgi:hypothetical protein
MRREALKRLLDAFEAIEAIERFIENCSLDHYLDNELIQSAVERKFDKQATVLLAPWTEMRGLPNLRDDAPWIHREGVLWHEPSPLLPSHLLPRSGPRSLRLPRGESRGGEADGDSLAGGAADTGGVDAGDGVGGLKMIRPARLLT